MIRLKRFVSINGKIATGIVGTVNPDLSKVGVPQWAFCFWIGNNDPDPRKYLFEKKEETISDGG